MPAYNTKLPDLCAARLPIDNSPILIRRGERGYHPAPGLDVDAYNARHNISEAVAEAMLIGSMFGWHVPGANPDDDSAFEAYAESVGRCAMFDPED